MDRSKKIVAKNKAYLKALILKRIEEEGPNCGLTDIDVSQITDMAYLFYFTKFNGDISNWNVSNVKTMESMFEGANFNGDISKWNISNVEDINYIFGKSSTVPEKELD